MSQLSAATRRDDAPMSEHQEFGRIGDIYFLAGWEEAGSASGWWRGPNSPFEDEPIVRAEAVELLGLEHVEQAEQEAIAFWLSLIRRVFDEPQAAGQSVTACYEAMFALRAWTQLDQAVADWDTHVWGPRG